MSEVTLYYRSRSRELEASVRVDLVEGGLCSGLSIIIFGGIMLGVEHNYLLLRHSLGGGAYTAVQGFLEILNTHRPRALR